MKVKVGPVEVEDDALNDEVLFKEYKKDPDMVRKYLSERSKYLDSTLKNAITGDSMKALGNFIFIAVFAICYSAWTIKVLQLSGPLFDGLKETYGPIWGSIGTIVIFMLLMFFPVGLVLLQLNIIFPGKKIKKIVRDKKQSHGSDTETDSKKE